MEQFLGFALPGIPYGCTYAIVAVALVLTYRATGVFNFAFAAQAYVASLLFTSLIQSAHLSAWLAFLIAVVVVSPLLGLAFDRLLFSKIPNSNNMAKLVSAISLLVGIPALMQVFIPAIITTYRRASSSTPTPCTSPWRGHRSTASTGAPSCLHPWCSSPWG